MNLITNWQYCGKSRSELLLTYCSILAYYDKQIITVQYIISPSTLFIPWMDWVCIQVLHRLLYHLFTLHFNLLYLGLLWVNHTCSSCSSFELTYRTVVHSPYSSLLYYSTVLVVCYEYINLSIDFQGWIISYWFSNPTLQYNCMCMNTFLYCIHTVWIYHFVVIFSRDNSDYDTGTP